MTTQSYGPVTTLPLSEERIWFGARLNDLRITRKQAGLRPTIDHAIGPYLTAETGMLAPGIEEIPRSAGKNYFTFISFKNEDERRLVDAYRSMLSNMQHRKEYGLPKILEGVNLQSLLEQTEAREVSTTPIVDADHKLPSAHLLPKMWAGTFSEAPSADVLEALRTSRFSSIAERLDYINAELADDPDWNIDQVHPDSIASFGTFLLLENPRVLPMVGLHPSGFVFAQWRVVNLEHDLHWDGVDGSLSMVFKPSNLVNYAASAGTAPDGAHTIVASGIMPVEDVKNSVEFFLSRAAEFDSDEG